MELKEKLKKILERDFNIMTDQELLEAVENINLDLGIFTTEIERSALCRKAS